MCGESLKMHEMKEWQLRLIWCVHIKLRLSVSVDANLMLLACLLEWLVHGKDGLVQVDGAFDFLDLQ